MITIDDVIDSFDSFGDAFVQNQQPQKELEKRFSENVTEVVVAIEQAP